LIPANRLIANVDGVMNAVLVKGDAVGATMYYGPGAGAEPTASSVIADLVDITRLHTADPEHRVPHLAFQPSAIANLPILPIDEVETCYYLRLSAKDLPGVLADVTGILAEGQISVDAMLQKPAAAAGETAEIIIVTHIAIEKNINVAIAKIESLASTHGKVVKLRLEHLNG
jgi:homoserine dehydrogenase